MAHRRINIVVRLQHWMDSIPGQTFLNYAYSWGAAIVILGTLFKLTHLKGADLMLFIGMGTEVVVFFLSAFDRPFDKKAGERDLADDYETDEEIAARMDQSEHTAMGGTVIIGGGQIPAGDAVPSAMAAASDAVAGGPVVLGTLSPALGQAEAALSPELEEASQAYVEKLRSLTEVLAKVEEQSRKLTQDSEEMVNLNRTLTGINTVYELQLKGISSQVGTIDQINEQTRRMAAQIEELNGVYARMIQALTVNMRNAAGASASSSAQ